ncbi:hypothetical protein BD779DRAFT_1671567 [Infundibulicybe gibba]|nr:hypothetical protein BD779DRAFT_1671567 [Infundibulicybe gibba]
MPRQIPPLPSPPPSSCPPPAPAQGLFSQAASPAPRTCAAHGVGPPASSSPGTALTVSPPAPPPALKIRITRAQIATLPSHASRVFHAVLNGHVPTHSYGTRFSLKAAKALHDEASKAPGPDHYEIPPSESDFGVFGEIPPASPSAVSKDEVGLPAARWQWQHVAYGPAPCPAGERACESGGEQDDGPSPLEPARAPQGARGRKRRKDAEASGLPEVEGLTSEQPDCGPGKKRRGSKAPKEEPGGGPKKKRRGPKAARPRSRGGKPLTQAGGNKHVARVSRLQDKKLREAESLQNVGFSMIEDARVAGTGWHGMQLKPTSREKLCEDCDSGTIKAQLAWFFPVYYKGQAVRLLDQDNRMFGYRTTTLPFIQEEAPSLLKAVRRLLGKHLVNEEAAKRHKDGVPKLTRFHRENAGDVDEFIRTGIVQKATQVVCSMVRLMFPGVAERLETSADWHQEQYGIRPQFDLFWNLCVNGIFPGQKRVHSRPHADYKNVVGVCALLVYEIPGRVKFNHSKRTWLVLWEAGIVVQLPPWVVFLYPSSLLTHFNIDIDVCHHRRRRATDPSQLHPLADGDDEGRGSFVYFNQAALYQSSETGHRTLTEAAKAGKATTVDYDRIAEVAFPRHGIVAPVAGDACP